VFRYGFATLRTEQTPADIPREALIVPKVKHHAAVIEPAKVGALLRAIDDYEGRGPIFGWDHEGTLVTRI
jgi:hypothetical protein